MENLKWAREQGCPWKQETWQLAVDSDNSDIAKWARENVWKEEDQVDEEDKAENFDDVNYDEIVEAA